MTKQINCKNLILDLKSDIKLFQKRIKESLKEKEYNDAALLQAKIEYIEELIFQIDEDEAFK